MAGDSTGPGQHLQPAWSHPRPSRPSWTNRWNAWSGRWEQIDKLEVTDVYLRLRILTNLGLRLCSLGRGMKRAWSSWATALELSDENTDYYKFSDLQMTTWLHP